ncbi:YqzE family protein [Cohnella thailandensis]|jgi:hypothetical protein|uniref:YqzE family protein n=1 Tax=Cohnella thailandensis TaxID=557557 RepID=A0A841SWX3_9BACL|nr:YqzE family protein [Cohnella thailandensis]MBB6634635.1 YqzE family protein [Cohnella thailandensis]MBP1972809.1 hypothetical protein [Cohnella thailandensis]
MAGEGAELAKEMFKRVATYLTTPAQGTKPEKERKRSRRLPWYTHVFGVLLPMGMHLWWQHRRRNKPHAPGS